MSAPCLYLPLAPLRALRSLLTEYLSPELSRLSLYSLYSLLSWGLGDPLLGDISPSGGGLMPASPGNIISPPVSPGSGGRELTLAVSSPATQHCHVSRGSSLIKVQTSQK